LTDPETERPALRKLAFPLAFLLGALVLFPGLGDFGLWDPWEMNPSHVARTAASKPLLLVGAERRELGTYPAIESLRSKNPNVVPHWLTKKPQTTANTSRLRARLTRTRAQFKDQGYHALVIPLSSKGDKRTSAGEDGWQDFIRQAKRKLPGSQIMIVGAGASAVATELYSLSPDVLGLETKAEFENALVTLSSRPAQLLRVSSDGEVYGLPVLKYWLAAASYQIFGFNEFATRFPNACLGLLTLLLVFGIASRIAGPWEGLLAVTVLLASSYFPVQARSVGGDMGFVAYLTLALWALIQLESGKAIRGGVGYIAAFTLLFLEKGLYGVALLSILVFAVGLFHKERLRAYLVLAGLSVLAVAGLAALVLGPENWTFFSHFRAMAHPFEGGVGEVDRSFDYQLLQIGFGFYPWSVLIPFALAWVLVRWLSGETKEGQMCGILVLWVVVPLVFLVATQLRFSHFVYPAGPAMGIVLAVFAAQMKNEERPWSLRVLFVVLFSYLLVSEIKLSPHALVGAVAWDPPFVFAFREIHEGVLYPEMVKVGRGYRLLGLFFCLWLAYSGLRGGLGLEKLREKYENPRVFFGGLVALMSLSLLWFTVSLGLKIQTMVLSSGGSIPRGNLHALNRLCWARPEHWFLYLALVWFIAAAILDLIDERKTVRQKLTAGGQLRFLSWFGLSKQPGSLLGGNAVWVLCGVSIVCGAALFGVVLSSSAGLPALWQGILHPAGLLFLLCGAASWLVSRPEKGSLFVAALSSGLVLFWGILASRAADVISPLSVVSVLLPLVGWLLFLGPIVRSRRSLSRVSLVALILFLGLALIVPIAQRFQGLVTKSRLPGVETFGIELFSSSPLTVLLLGVLCLWVAVSWSRRLPGLESAIGTLRLHGGLVLGVIVLLFALKILAIFADPEVQPLASVVSWLPLWVLVAHGLAFALARWRGATTVVRSVFSAALWLERPQVMVVGLALVSLLLSVQLVHGFVPELSLHVSQKHILDRYHSAVDGQHAGPGAIFRYGQFSASAKGDKNFYIQSIPDVSSQSAILEVLGARKDVPVALTESPFLDLPEHRVFQAFSDKNDLNRDGSRDWVADTGVAQKVEVGKIYDPTKSWSADQWKGSVLLDGSGASFRVTGNSANTVHYALPPGGKAHYFGAKVSSMKSFYILDHPEAEDHFATADSLSRAFVILPKTEFSNLNHKFRKHNGGRSIPVLDDRSSHLMLVSSSLAQGDEDKNWIASHLVEPEEYESLDGFRKVDVNFNDKIRLVGIRVWDKVYRRGKTLKLSFFFKVEGALSRSYKVFVHIDRPGGANRIGADHWVLNLPGNEKEKKCMGCFRTDHWMVGDVVEDRFEAEIPVGSGVGPHRVWMGLYEPGGGKRLKVKDFDKESVKHDGGDRVDVGSITVM